MRAPAAAFTTAAAAATGALLFACSTTTVQGFVPPSPLVQSPPSASHHTRLAASSSVQQQGRRAGGMRMLLNLGKKESTAPPFATEAERESDPGIKVSPSAWKWPPRWPYNADYFSRKVDSSVPVNESPNLAPVFDENAAAAIAGHYKRFLPEGGAVLELGASAHSYLPEDLSLGSLVGVGVNEEEMQANARLTERKVQDLNAETTLPFADESFDVVIVANAMEFLVKPREVLREAWRTLKPGGRVIVSFAKNKVNEDRQIKIWGTMNDDQRVWIIGSFLHFACNEGFTELKGYDLSEADAKGMMAGLSGKTPLHIVQATKAELPGPEADTLTRMRAALWTSNLEQEDKSLCLARLYSSYQRAETDADRERLLKAVSYLPRLYAVLNEMGNAIPGQLKALLAVRIAEEFHGTDSEVQQLRQGLGLDEPSEDFWAPLGKMTGMMNAEDKVLLLGECVPMHEGTAEEQQALKELVTVLPQVIEYVKATCPDMTKTDAQVLAVDLAITDFLHEPAEQRAGFLGWVKGLNAIDLEGYLEARKTYKEEKPAAAEI